MVQPKSRSVFGHARGGQEGTDGKSPNSAVHLITGNPATNHERHSKQNVAEIPAMPPLTLNLLSHRNMKTTAT